MRTHRIIFFVGVLALYAVQRVHPETPNEIPILTDGLAADMNSAAYRTGVIDKKVVRVPPKLERGVFRSPEKNLKALTDYLINDAENDFLKIKRIHDWITKNIAYDNALVEDYVETGKITNRDISRILKLKRTECGGFSRLFIKMANLAGVQAIAIKGYQRRFTSIDGAPATHVWNAVNINNKFYIVDTSRDRRFHFNRDGFEKLGKYKDAELFIHPEAKLLLQFPKNPEHQLLSPRISAKEFKKMPFYDLGYVKYNSLYNLKFLNDFKEMITRKIVAKKAKTYVALSDLIEIEKPTLDIKVAVDPNVRVLCTLRDKAGKHKKKYYYIEKKNEYYLCQISYPDQEIYTVDFYAKYNHPDVQWSRLYQFKIKGKMKSGPKLP